MPEESATLQAAATIKAQELARDLEELQSRGFGHPAADQIVGRMRVTLQQLQDDFAAPPPPPEPETLHAMVSRVEASIAALNETACTINAALAAQQPQ